MRYSTYVKKYEMIRDSSTPRPLKMKLTAELKREVKKAVNNWLLINGHLGNAKSFHDWHVAWHSIDYIFTLSPNSAVEVALSSADFSFARGNTSTLLKKHRIAKKALFT